MSQHKIHLTYDISFVVLAVVVVAAFVGGQALAVLHLGGFSMTAWLTVATSILAMVNLFLAARKGFPGNPYSNLSTSKKAVLLSVSILALYMTTWLVFSISLNGLQVYLSVVTIGLVATAAYLFDSLRIWRVAAIGTVVLLVASTVLLLINVYWPFFPGASLQWRDRGEILALVSATAPVLVKRRFVASGILFFFAIMTVLTDSRFSTLVLVFIVGLSTFAILERIKFPWRVLVAILSSFAFSILAHGLQVFLGLRRSFPFPTTWGPKSEPNSEVSPSPLSPGDLADFGSPGSQENYWSSGRAEVWAALISNISGWREIAFGHGLGSASDVGVMVNPAFNHPHNEYLRFLFDLGVLGFIFLLACLLSVLLLLVRIQKTIERKSFIVGLSLWFVLCAHALISNPLVTTHFFIPFAFLFGLVVSGRNLWPTSLKRQEK